MPQAQPQVQYESIPYTHMDYPYLILIRLNEAAHKLSSVDLRNVPKAHHTVSTFVLTVKSLALILAPDVLGKDFVNSVIDEVSDAEYLLGYLMPGYAPPDDDVMGILRKWGVGVKLPKGKEVPPNHLAALALAEDALKRIVFKLDEKQLLMKKRTYRPTGMQVRGVPKW